jgi:Required for nuclear transport of RNA pol II C-terminus 1
MLLGGSAQFWPANEDMSARTLPVLNDIFSLLEPLAKHPSSAIGAPAREARMVMTARLASTSALGAKGSAKDHDSAQEIYQKALKLLQDPILPVRAHGLLLLRQLVSPASRGSNKLTLDDYALVPAILSIFLQSIEDDDSYLFLNAVQGLAAMADTFGKDVFRSLVEEYAGNVDSANLTQRDVDIRIRVGEALGIVIRRCGDALSIHGECSQLLY